MTRLIDKFRDLLPFAPRDPFIETMEVSAMLSQQREDDWNRVSAMAGLTPDGSIAPPPPGLTISRKPVTWWTTRYSREEQEFFAPLTGRIIDMTAQARVEGRSRS